jgi:hypothetical protein
MTHPDYKHAMLRRFGAYRRRHYAIEGDAFAPRHNHVFKPEFASLNLFKLELGHLLPKVRRYRRVRSMGSSQALAVSVFGIMIQLGRNQIQTRWHQTPIAKQG